MASATLVVVLNGDPLSPLSVTLAGTKASHTTTFSRPMDATFSMSRDEWVRFRMGVAQWMVMTGEYSHAPGSLEYEQGASPEAVTRDAQSHPQMSEAPTTVAMAAVHPTYSRRQLLPSSHPYGMPGGPVKPEFRAQESEARRLHAFSLGKNPDEGVTNRPLPPGFPASV